MDTQTSIATLVAKSQALDHDKEDYIAQVKLFSFNNETAGLVCPPRNLLNPDDAATEPLKLTDHAMRQLCTKLAPAVYGKGTTRVLPIEYLSAIPAPLRATVLNDHIQHVNGNRWTVRRYKDTARAILGGDYPASNHGGAFENTQCLQIVQDFIESVDDNPEIKFVRPYVGSDDIHIKLTWCDVRPRGDDNDVYGLGFYIGNDEVGAGRLKVLPHVQRHACTNSIISDTENAVALIHRGSFAAMRTQFKAAIGTALRISADMLNRFLVTEDERIEDFDLVIAGICDQYGWRNNEIRDAVMLGTEGKKTRAAIVNGLTYAAHSVGDMKQDKQIEFEMLGGRMLYAPVSTFAKAAEHHLKIMRGLDN